jgi:serine/threonine protein kinase
MADDTPQAHPLPFDVPSVEEMNALLPQYEFRKLAAFGGMGAVYRAQQASLDRPVAVKILPPAFGKEAEFADRFKTEARAMAKLNHTNIVTVYDFGITREGHFYLVMEWVEGHTLHELVQKGSMPLRKVANYVMQLCDALHFAHSHKILHRDVKPGNIMVNDEDRVKVADFGLARPMTGEAEENPFGTPDYAAPEIMDKRGVDQRADIFAAGVVLYELLTGRVPATPRRSVTEYSPVHKRWDEIIAKATDPDPDKRYPDALEFRAHIAAALTIGTNASAVVTETKPVAKEPEPSAPKPAAKPSPLPKIAMAAAAVIMVLFVVLLKPSGEPEKAVEAEKPAPKLEKPAEEPKKVAEAPPVEKPAKVEKAPEPPMKVEEPKKVVVVEPAPAMAATKPEPTPPPAPAPAPTSAELLAKLESSDPELTQILVGITAAWDANPEANPGPAKKDLAFKYIPYLQKSLPTTPPAQRDPILSEISNVANNQPLLPVEESWPAALKQLRQTYDTQISAITSKADAASKALLQSQQASLLQLAKDRAAKGDAAGAKRAELIATALLQITGRPTIEALKETGGKL